VNQPRGIKSLPSRAAFDYYSEILEAIKHAEEITGAQNFEEYQANRTNKRAVERLLMIITEASILLSEGDKQLCDYTDWRDMRNLGNRIRHAYFSLDDHQIWLIIKDDLPSLKKAVEKTLRDHFAGSSAS
jgi:uncharacterized protein with HEPN domain